MVKSLALDLEEGVLSSKEEDRISGPCLRAEGRMGNWTNPTDVIKPILHSAIETRSLLFC